MLGAVGLDLVDRLLEWDPAARPRSADGALGHDYFFRNSLTIGGLLPDGCKASAGTFTGARHEWNVLTGVVSPDVLGWLRSDKAFVPGSPEHEALRIDFGDISDRDDAKSEEERKYILAGALGNCSSQAMCALSLKKPLPSGRVQAWFKAFKNVNEKAIGALADAAVAATSGLSADDRGENGNHFLTTPAEQWFLTCGEIAVTSLGDSPTGLWAEPKHQDGAASVLHLGLTLFGRRDVVFDQLEGSPSITVSNIPGSVYMGGVTGAKHQVLHKEPANPNDRLVIPGLGPCSVTIMFRTALFPHTRSRLRNATPHPPLFFKTLSASFRASLASTTWVLPSLSECEACLSPEGSEQETPPSKKARK